MGLDDGEAAQHNMPTISSGTDAENDHFRVTEHVQHPEFSSRSGVNATRPHPLPKLAEVRIFNGISGWLKAILQPEDFTIDRKRSILSSLDFLLMAK